MYQENNGFLEEVFDMRKILKIIVAPFVLVLILAVAVISFLSCIAGACCGLACAVFVLLAICGFFAGLETGCSWLGMIFLSPISKGCPVESGLELPMPF